MPQARPTGIQVVPYVGGIRPDGTVASPGLRRAVPAGPGAVALRWVVPLAVATLLIDIVGASEARSFALAIGAVQSGSQALMAAAAVLVARHRSSPAAGLPFDLSRAEALAQFLSGLVLLVLSVPIAYRALGDLCVPEDCDAAVSAGFLALGLCSSGLSGWLLLRATPGAASPPTPLRPMPASFGSGRCGLFTAAAAGHLVDIQTSAALLLAMLVSALCGWAWVDAVAGLAGCFFMSTVAARLVVASGAALIDAGPAEVPN